MKIIFDESDKFSGFNFSRYAFRDPHKPKASIYALKTWFDFEITNGPEKIIGKEGHYILLDNNKDFLGVIAPDGFTISCYPCPTDHWDNEYGYILSGDDSALAVDVGNIMYSYAAHLFEFLEGKGRFMGNGHHAAQKVSIFAKWIILTHSRDEKVREEGNRFLQSFRSFMGI